MTTSARLAAPGAVLAAIDPSAAASLSIGRPLPAPAPAPTGGSRTSERYYVGRRARKAEVYVVAGTEIGRLAHPGYRSDAPFDWGKRTPGALELAFAILAHTTGSRPPDPICLIFRTEVVAGLDRAGFVLGEGDIALWLLTSFDPRDDAPDTPPDRSRGAGRHPLAWLRSRLGR